MNPLNTGLTAHANTCTAVMRGNSHHRHTIICIYHILHGGNERAAVCVCECALMWSVQCLKQFSVTYMYIYMHVKLTNLGPHFIILTPHLLCLASSTRGASASRGHGSAFCLLVEDVSLRRNEWLLMGLPTYQNHVYISHACVQVIPWRVHESEF